jgi:heme oxygenase
MKENNVIVYRFGTEQIHTTAIETYWMPCVLKGVLCFERNTLVCCVASRLLLKKDLYAPQLKVHLQMYLKLHHYHIQVVGITDEVYFRLH